MGKTIRPVNGAIAQEMTKALNAPIIPVKTQEQLLRETDMEREIARLKAENEALKNKPGWTTGLSLRVSEKGALSVYGMGRFPFTLYVEQWERLLAMADDIKAFIKANGSKLSRKQVN